MAHNLGGCYTREATYIKIEVAQPEMHGRSSHSAARSKRYEDEKRCDAACFDRTGNWGDTRGSISSGEGMNSILAHTKGISQNPTGSSVRKDLQLSDFRTQVLLPCIPQIPPAYSYGCSRGPIQGTVFRDNTF